MKMPPSGPFEPYVLTPLDHSTAFVHFSFFLSFLCQDIDPALSALENGVERLTTLLPFLAGNIVPSVQLKGTKNVFEVQPADSSHLSKLPMLRIKRHALCILPHNADMRNSALSSDGLFNCRFMPLQSPMPISEPQPVLRFQANVMTDGIVLCMSFHHLAVDGIGVYSILEALSKCCRSPDLPSLPTSPESETQARTKIFQSGNGIHLARSYEGSRSDVPNAAPDPNSGALISCRFRLDDEKIRWLREVCIAKFNHAHRASSPEYDASAQIFSNNEVVTSLIWLCGMRALSRVASEERERPALPGLHSSLLFAVDVREILNIPRTYMGNAIVTPTPKYYFKGAELRDTDPLAFDSDASSSQEFTPNDIALLTRLARLVQQSYKSVNPDYVQNAISHIMASKDWHLPARHGDISISSLRGVPAYDLDFGPCLGTPYDIDVPDNRGEGVCWITPLRSGSNARLIGYQSRGFWELRLTLNAVAMECLKSDRIWRRLILEKGVERTRPILNKL